MIRVAKSSVIPCSLSTTKAYDGSDVLQQLEDDHHMKCYLCERSLCTDFQVEHHQSKEIYPELRQDWNNLFWTCAYCNGKKRHRNEKLITTHHKFLFNRRNMYRRDCFIAGEAI